MPADVGSFIVQVPAVSATDKATVPEVVPLRLTIPVEDDAVPTVILVPNVGAVEKTSDPDPVSSVTAAARFALDGVPSHVAMPVPSDVKPVPPLAAANVPVIVMVPEVVIGPPENVSPVDPPLTSTLVTVPSGLVAHDVFEPSVVRYLPLLPP